jgi:formamidopyrimidine-DNA glycosylase
MPELPEVETMVRGLKRLEGQKLHLLEVHDARVWFESELSWEKFRGQTLTEISRRGKMLAPESASIPEKIRASAATKKNLSPASLQIHLQ